MSYIRYVRHQRVGYSCYFDPKLGINFDILVCNWISFSCPKASTSVWVARQFQCKRYPSASWSYHHSTMLPSYLSLPHNLPLSLPRQLPSPLSSLFPSASCYRKEENQQLATNAILPTGAIEIVDKIASKIAVNIARVNGALLALWRSIFSFFQIHSIPVHDFYGLRNGPTLIDILFSIYKGFTFATKKMMPFTFKINIPKTLPLLPNCQTLKRTRNRPESPSYTLVLQLMCDN